MVRNVSVALTLPFLCKYITESGRLPGCLPNLADLALRGFEEATRAWTAQSTGLMSTTGVPSMTSMGPMRSRFLATSRTVTG